MKDLKIKNVSFLSLKKLIIVFKLTQAEWMNWILRSLPKNEEIWMIDLT